MRPEVSCCGFHRFMLGAFEIAVILDGMRTFDGPHPMFGANRNAGEVGSLTRANFLPADRMIGQFNPVLVNSSAALILFETGNGPEGSAVAMSNMRLGRRKLRCASTITFGLPNHSA